MTIDCSRMSHAECLPPEELEITSSSASETPIFGSYDCINDCVSSLGVVGLVSATLTGAGCVALPPACPILLGAGAGSMLGACNAACVELERP